MLISSKTSLANNSLFTKKFKYPPTTSILTICDSSTLICFFISSAITGGAFLNVFANLKQGKEKGQISWNSKREYDGTKKFEVRLKLVLDKPSLGNPISKSDRKMIAEQIELLSDGKIECKVPYVDFNL